MNDVDPTASVDARGADSSLLSAKAAVSRDEPSEAGTPTPSDTEALEDVSAFTVDSRTGEHGNRTSRKEEILDAAAELFAEYGYHGASLRDISRRVGISHPGMLHHFESKDILLNAVIDRLEGHAQEALDRVDALAADPTALLNSLINIWHPASHMMQLLAMLTTDAVSEDHPGRFRMSRLRRVHEHILEKCFVRLAENGQLRTGIDPAFASRAFIDLVLGHAVREKTVRVMQDELHHDSPIEDLTKLLRAFLKHKTEG